MTKIAVSKDWTYKERLALIYLITASVLGSKRILTVMEMQDVVLISNESSDFLELNRKNFAKYLTPDQ